MQLILTFSILLILYAYIGYPVHVWLLARFFPCPIAKGNPADIASTVSIVISARNEQGQIRQRIENLFEQDYPKAFIEIIFVSDGSTDATVAIIQQMIDEQTESNIKLLVQPTRMGKPAALNLGVTAANSEFILFTDCRQTFAPDVIRQLLANFDDSNVGCVSGELKFFQDSDSQIQTEMGIYWKYEKFVRKSESRSGSVVGATGAIYAIRRELYCQLPEEALIDDVLTPLNISNQGKRIIFEPEAIAYDVVSLDTTQEWRRKVRTLAGNWQLLQLCPGLLNPFKSRICWRFVGHKLSRLLVPFALLVLLGVSLLSINFYLNIFGFAQIVFYLLATGTHFKKELCDHKVLNISYFFCLLNCAAWVGFWRWATGRSGSTWQGKGGA